MYSPSRVTFGAVLRVWMRTGRYLVMASVVERSGGGGTFDIVDVMLYVKLIFSQ